METLRVMICKGDIEICSGIRGKFLAKEMKVKLSKENVS